MLSGDFERKLRSLNHRLRIYCGNNDIYSAGIYIVTPSGEYTEICGADKSIVPEYTHYDATGRIKKSGWRRILKILINKGLVSKHKAKKAFNTYLDGRAPSRPKIKQDSGLQRLKNLGVEIIDAGSY